MNAPDLKSSREYMQEAKTLAICTWSSACFLLVVAVVWLYFGGKSGPWILLAFAFLQNVPMAIRYTFRYKNWNELAARTNARRKLERGSTVNNDV